MLFGAVNLTKNADIDKYKYSGYWIGFDRRSCFSFPASGLGKNVIIFGADMSLILGKGPTQRFWFCNKMYSINFTKHSKKFHLSLH